MAVALLPPRLVIYRKNHDARAKNNAAEDPSLRASLYLPHNFLLALFGLAADFQFPAGG